MKVVGHFENRAALGTVGITPRKVLAVILRACDFISLRKKLWPEVLMNLRCLKRFSE
jgi:hypothetical protein